MSSSFQCGMKLKSPNFYAQALKHSHFCKFACSEEIPELQDMGGPVDGMP